MKECERKACKNNNNNNNKKKQKQKQKETMRNKEMQTYP